MSTNVNDMIAKLTDFLRSEAKTESVIGTPFQLGEFSCIPVIGIGLGLGAGGNAKSSEVKESEMGGAGIGMAPIGFLVSRGDQIQFLSSRPASGLNAAFEKVPDLISKFVESKKEQK